MQLSLLSAGVDQPQPGDVEGLLVASGQLVTIGKTVRLSILVDHPARADLLCAEYIRRELNGDYVSTDSGMFSVRTAFHSKLFFLAQSWIKGALTLPPDALCLTGEKLRLWAIAKGKQERVGYSFGSIAFTEQQWQPVARALSTVGLPSVASASGNSLGYRVTGRRALRRLRELVGDLPAGIPADFWPSA